MGNYYGIIYNSKRLETTQYKVKKLLCSPKKKRDSSLRIIIKWFPESIVKGKKVGSAIGCIVYQFLCKREMRIYVHIFAYVGLKKKNDNPEVNKNGYL